MAGVPRRECGLRMVEEVVMILDMGYSPLDYPTACVEHSRVVNNMPRTPNALCIESSTRI
jgi:hypothetical protein